MIQSSEFLVEFGIETIEMYQVISR